MRRDPSVEKRSRLSPALGEPVADAPNTLAEQDGAEFGLFADGAGWAPSLAPPSETRQPIPMLYRDRCFSAAKLVASHQVPRMRDILVSSDSTN